MEWFLNILLLVLLAATLFHAVRLERALGSLRRDRTALEALVGTFNASTHAAESGIERLRVTTDGAGRQIQRQIETATTLKEDLTFLVQRGEGLADRMDELVRASRPALAAGDHIPSRTPYPRQAEHMTRGPEEPATRGSVEQSGRGSVDRASRGSEAQATRGSVAQATRGSTEIATRDEEPRVRSQAERDLLKALRMAR